MGNYATLEVVILKQTVSASIANTTTIYSSDWSGSVSRIFGGCRHPQSSQKPRVTIMHHPNDWKAALCTLPYVTSTASSIHCSNCKKEKNDEKLRSSILSYVGLRRNVTVRLNSVFHLLSWNVYWSIVKLYGDAVNVSNANVHPNVIFLGWLAWVLHSRGWMWRTMTSRILCKFSAHTDGPAWKRSGFLGKLSWQNKIRVMAAELCPYHLTIVDDLINDLDNLFHKRPVHLHINDHIEDFNGAYAHPAIHSYYNLPVLI